MARRRTRRLVLGLVAGGSSAALVACSLLTGLDADYKLQSNTTGNEGGKDGDPPGDGSPDDARTDTTPPTDGGNDGSVPTAYCASVDAGPNGFCWDFEKPSAGAPSWGWSDSLAVGGSYTVLDGIGVNKSKALRAGITDSRAASGQAYLRETVAGGKFTDFRHHELSFYYSITKGTPLYTSVLGAVGFGGNGNEYVGAAIYAAGTTPGVVDISDPPGGAAGTSIPVTLGEWKQVRITIDRPGDAGSYMTTVAIDGTRVDDGPPAFNAGASTSPTQIWVGTFFSAKGDGGVEAVIDNVLVRQWN